MTFANPLPWWALAAIIVAAAVVAWFTYHREPLPGRYRSALSALRFVTLALLVLLLMRPVASIGGDPAADAVVPVLVDTSRSMSIEDAGGMRRIDRVRQLLGRELLPVLASRFQVDVLAFGEGLTPTTLSGLSASARTSDLSGALHALGERYRGRVVPGVLLISDGGDTGETRASMQAQFIAPIFSMGVGARTIGRDREVLSLTAAEAVLDDSRVDLAVSAVSHGHGTDPIELRVAENGRLIDVRRVAPAVEGVPIHTVIHVEPEKGVPTVYSVEIPAAAGELVPENNGRSVLVHPPSRARRVLLVQGAPGYEHSFLRRAWSGDTGLEVDSVVRNGKNDEAVDTFYIQAPPARSPMLASGYPTTPSGLFAYDAIVLANIEGTLLTHEQLEATREFVGRRGGGLLVLGAQSFIRRGLVGTPLEE